MFIQNTSCPNPCIQSWNLETSKVILSSFRVIILISKDSNTESSLENMVNIVNVGLLL